MSKDVVMAGRPKLEIRRKPTCFELWDITNKCMLDRWHLGNEPYGSLISMMLADFKKLGIKRGLI